MRSDYTLDTVGRRTAVVFEGTAFSGGPSGEHHWEFGYNGPRSNELTNGNRREGLVANTGDNMSPNYQYEGPYKGISPIWTVCGTSGSAIRF